MASGEIQFCTATGRGAVASGARRSWCVTRIAPAVAWALIFACGAGAQSSSYHSNDLIAEAAAARTQNDIPRAITLYSQAVEKNPKWPDGWWFLGSLQYETGAYGPAREALSHYIAMMPTAGPAFALRGLCEFEAGEYAQSLPDIRQAISLGAANEPRNEQILRYHEGLLQTRLGDYAAALKTYSVFAKNGVNNPEFLLALGLAGLRMPLLPKDVAPDQQELVSAAGDAALRFMAGDESSAAPAFQELFERFPKAANAHFLYGYLLFADNPDAALEQFQQELAVTPSNADADVMAAWALLMRNAPGDALPYAEKAADEQPSLPSAQLVLGRSLMDTGDLKDGMEHLEKAREMDPNNLENHLALAKAYSKSGRKEDARRERLLCLRLTSGNGTTTGQP